MGASRPLRVAVVALAALAATSASAALIVSESNAASFYRDYRRLTMAPRRVDPLIASLCTTPGYDAANGDWEYFYYGGRSQFSSGRIANCIECHRAAEATDFVYSVRTLTRQ
jgi:hypothetical protein